MVRNARERKSIVSAAEVPETPVESNAADRPLVLIALSISLVMLLWMARPLLTHQIPTTGDLFHFHYPVRDFFARALDADQRCTWMPSLFGGFYVAGEGQLGPFHPLHWMLYRGLPLDVAFGIELVLPYPLLLAGTWLFLRRGCQPAPAALGALLLSFCSFTLSHAWHINLILVLAHLPWLLLAIHTAFTAQGGADRLQSGAAIGLLTGSQLLLGHPQGVWLSGLIEAAYTLLLITLPWSAARWRHAAIVVAGKLLGVAIGAIQLLATIDAARESVRAEQDAEVATEFSLPPARLFELVHPYLFREQVMAWSGDVGDEFAVYGGAVGLVLAAWWLALIPQLRAQRLLTPADRLALAAAMLGLLGMWLATGRYGGLYYVQTWLPLVGQFRSPARYMLFVQLAIAVMGAVALGRLLSSANVGRSLRDRQRVSKKPAYAVSLEAARRALRAPWCLAAVSTSIALLDGLSAGERTANVERMLALSLGPLLFVAASALLTLALRGMRGALLGLIALAGVELALFGLVGVVAWQKIAPRAEALQAQAAADPLPPPGGGRIIRGEMDSVYVLSGHRLLDGYAGIMPARRLNYLSLPALRVAQVEFIHNVFQQVANIPGAEVYSEHWYRVPDVLPRARLVAQSRISSQPDVDLERIDIERSALVLRELSLTGGDPGAAQIVRDDPGEIHVTTRTSSRQLLMISEAFHDGWTAEIDGQPALVQRVNGDFFGCVVEPGNHQVVFVFQPAHLALGKGVSLLGLMIALALVASPWLLPLSRKRRPYV